MAEQYEISVTTLSSVIAGGISRLFVHPLDTIKAKLQVQQATKCNEFTNIREAGRLTMKREGIKGLYKGLVISVFGSIPAVSIYFTAYEVSKQALLKYKTIEESPFLAYLCSGMIAETFSCMIFVPIDVIKERLQVQSNLKLYNYKGGLDALREIGSKEGVRGIYKAYGATIMSFGPFSALYFLFYENFKQMVVGNQKEISFGPSLFCAGSAGTLAAFITNPLDMAKLRMQVVRASRASNVESSFDYKNIFDGLYKIYRSEGVRALFQGSLARILFHTPNTAIIMSLIEYIRPQLEKVLK